MHVVEIFEDGREEDLSQCMEVTSDETIGTTPSVGMYREGQPMDPIARAQPLVPVKLLKCKPLSTATPKLMLWVDGCLTPALRRPLFINLSDASALAARPRPTPTPYPTGEDWGMSDNDCNGKLEDRSPPRIRPTRTHPEAWPAVVVEDNAEGACRNDRVGDGRPDVELMGGVGTKTSSPLSARPIPCTTSPGASGRHDPVEAVSPATLSAKRMRPASAFTVCSARAGEGYKSSSCGNCLHHITDAIVDWQLESSPPKRPTLSVQAAAGSRSSRCDAPSPSITTQSFLRVPSACTTVTNSMAAAPLSAGARACPQFAATGKSLMPSVEVQHSIAEGPLDKSKCKDTGSGSASAPPTGSPEDQPPAPPPSPVIGRPAPRDVFGFASKRKQREELPSMLVSMESGLNAMRIEPRPSKFVRCTYA